MDSRGCNAALRETKGHSSSFSSPFNFNPDKKLTGKRGLLL
ncbi:hypothetical protein AmDm5_2442 [Acetobacter malorum]|nr:hypothetical protein AmDm5_2442 [Acetobacter malorum]